MEVIQGVIMMPPFELPAEITGPSAWYGPQVASRTDWIFPFGDEEIAEIESAIPSLEESIGEPGRLSREDFPLPTLSRRLSKILTEVLDGKGFVLLRGLPVHEWGA